MVGPCAGTRTIRTSNLGHCICSSLGSFCRSSAHFASPGCFVCFVYFVDRFVQVLKVRSTKYTNHMKQMQPLRRRKVRRRCVQKIYLSFHLVIDSITSQPLRSRDTISPVPGCRRTFLFQFLEPPREKTTIRFLPSQPECFLIRSTGLLDAP